MMGVGIENECLVQVPQDGSQFKPPPPPMVASMQNGPKFDLTFFLNLRPGIYPKSPDSLDL